MIRTLFIASVLSIFSVVLFAQNPATEAQNKEIETRAGEIVPFLSKEPRCVGKPITDRTAWGALADEPGFRNVIKDAENTMKTPIPELPESLYKEFFQNGNRTNFQRVRGWKYGRLSKFVLAECLENKGRFIPPLEETIRSICDDPSWVLPAHDHEATVYDGKAVYIDLVSSAVSAELGLAGTWLGDKLSPEIRTLIREQVRRRTFEPYESSIRSGNIGRNWWIKGTNNWNSVCHANVVAAAMTLIDDPKLRAWYIAASEKFMEPFFRGFTPDGYCSEGMGYWNYGFGHFVLLSECVFQATGGKVDFMMMPKVRNCSLFGPRMEVAPGLFAAFADCSITSRPDASLVGFLSRRLQFGFEKYEQTPKRPSSLFSTGVYCFPNSADATPKVKAVATSLSDARTEFPDAGILICRPKENDPAQLAFVCKGGHNAEHHNHNDVASFTVMYAGTLPLLDPGGEVYTRRTFSGRRYESKLLNSFGHPVPVINGQLQKTGRKSEGKIVSKTFTDEKDTMAIDYASVYGLKDIKKLERTFEFVRTAVGTPNTLSVTDELELEPAGTFETALLTYESWNKTDGNDPSKIELLIGTGKNTIRAVIAAADGDKTLPLEFSTVEIDEDAMARKKPIRFGFKIKDPVKCVRVVVTVTPEPNP